MNELDMLDFRLARQLESLAFNYNIKNIMVLTNYDESGDYLTSVKIIQSSETESFLVKMDNIFSTYWKGELVNMYINNLHVEYIYYFKHIDLPLITPDFFDYRRNIKGN